MPTGAVSCDTRWSLDGAERALHTHAFGTMRQARLALVNDFGRVAELISKFSEKPRAFFFVPDLVFGAVPSMDLVEVSVPENHDGSKSVGEVLCDVELRDMDRKVVHVRVPQRLFATPVRVEPNASLRHGTHSCSDVGYDVIRCLLFMDTMIVG